MCTAARFIRKYRQDLLAVAVVGFSCRSIGTSSSRQGPSTSAIVIASERAPGGARLVRVGENGSRLQTVTNLRSTETIVDRSPFFASNGGALVFASNRDRNQLDSTSLWSVPVDGGTPIRLTRGEHIDRDPRISSDGRWLYFCSDRSGNFELYRGHIDSQLRTVTEIQAITSGVHAVLSPSLSPDGTEAVYMGVDDNGDSSLWKVKTDGADLPTQLTEGPRDITPAWSRTGWIAYSAAVEGREDSDLYILPSDGGISKRVISHPDTDETGPRWSIDGRYLFAIGVYRSAVDHQPMFGSIIFVDLQEMPKRFRVLHDRAGAESRIGLAVLPDFLDPAAMRENPLYRDALRKVILNAVLRNERESSIPKP